MSKSLTVAAILFSCILFLAGSSPAQQSSSNPPANPPTAKQSSSAKTAQSSSLKPPTKSAATSKSKTASRHPAAMTLKTERDKASYAIGLNMGRNLHRDAVEVNTTALLEGLRDALAGRKPLLTDQEAQAALAALQVEVRRTMEAKRAAESSADRSQGDAYLAENKLRPGVVGLPSGLQYKVLRQGDGPKPVPGDTVVCNYRGTLVDGKEFDSSYRRGQPAKFPVTGVIKGWTEALQLMPVGSKWQVVIPPALAYGGRGNGELIGPDATLVFEIELLSIESKPAPAAK